MITEGQKETIRETWKQHMVTTNMLAAVTMGAAKHDVVADLRRVADGIERAAREVAAERDRPLTASDIEAKINQFFGVK